MSPSPRELAEQPPAESGPGDFLTLGEWRDRHGLVAGITTVAAGDYGLHSPGPAGEVVSRWLALPGCIGGGFAGTVVARQVHSSRILSHAAAPGWRVFDGCDGHRTSDRGLLLAVTAADCVPVYLAAPECGVIALVHAGWRGTAAGILEAAVDRLDAPAAQVTVHLGVGVCGECYEVGPEVVSALGLPEVTGPTRVDLRQVLANRASRAGVGSVTVSPWCARHDTRFHSHRRDGAASGRMAAFLGWRSP